MSRPASSGLDIRFFVFGLVAIWFGPETKGVTLTIERKSFGFRVIP